MTIVARDSFVYFIIDSDDNVLYVGRSKNPWQRWNEHRAVKPGVAKAARRFKLRGPFTLEVAARIEQSEIARLHPRFNVQHASPASTAVITTTQVARKLKVDTSTVRKWVKLHRLTPVITTPGRHYRFNLADIEAFTPHSEEASA